MCPRQLVHELSELIYENFARLSATILVVYVLVMLHGRSGNPQLLAERPHFALPLRQTQKTLHEAFMANMLPIRHDATIGYEPSFMP